MDEYLSEILRAFQLIALNKPRKLFFLWTEVVQECSILWLKHFGEIKEKNDIAYHKYTLAKNLITFQENGSLNYIFDSIYARYDFGRLSYLYFCIDLPEIEVTSFGRQKNFKGKFCISYCPMIDSMNYDLRDEEFFEGMRELFSSE